MSTLPINFLGLDGDDCAYERARYAVFPVAYDGTVSYRTGTREGPVAIVLASRQVELFDADLDGEIHRPGIATLDPFEPDARSAEATLESIYRSARKVVRDGKFLLALGGEHSISSALIRAVKTKVKTFSVLHVDAHLDMRDTWQKSEHSHACVIRRVHELDLPTVSVGIRNIAQEEHRYLKRGGHTVVTAEQVYRDRDAALGEALDALTDTVYVTVDMDGFDPAYAPGVGTPEPGGLTWYDVVDLLRGVAGNGTIIGADIVETLPIPGQVATEFLAAKLAAKIIALTQTGN